MRRSAVLAVSLAFAALSTGVGAPAAAEASPGSGRGAPKAQKPLFTMNDERIQESSGLAASHRHEGVYWTHNDSGPYAPEIYAVNEQGRTVATITLAGEGVELRDWEAITVGTGDGGDPQLYVGDIGDNFQGRWPDIRVYRLPEPAELTDQVIEATTFTFAYEDGGRNAEGMTIDPRNNRLHILSKEVAGGVYAAPRRLDAEGTNTLERVDSAPLYATGAAFSPEGSYYAVRTYWSATVYDATEGVPGPIVERVPLPKSEQGESLAFSADGRSLLAGTEGQQSPVWSVPLEAADEEGNGNGGSSESGGAGNDGGASEESGGRESPGAGGGASGADERDAGPGAAALIWTGAGLAAALIAGIVLLARRS